MKILFLGYNKEQTRLISILENDGHKLIQSFEEISPKEASRYEMVVSFGYKKILSSKTIEACMRPPINLHISFLPYNRGFYPNFWAWYDNTPHGVSIHHIDKKIDLGDIIIQKQVFFDEEITLSKSYNTLIRNVEDLFIHNKDKILSYNYTPKKQKTRGTIHNKIDLPHFKGGWDQTIKSIKSQLKGIES